MEQDFELIGIVKSQWLKMHQNIQWLSIKVCRPKNYQHIGGLSPTMGGFFLSKQVMACLIDDSRSEMSVIAFRTAPPIGGLT